MAAVAACAYERHRASGSGREDCAASAAKNRCKPLTVQSPARTVLQAPADYRLAIGSLAGGLYNVRMQMLVHYSHVAY